MSFIVWFEAKYAIWIETLHFKRFLRAISSEIFCTIGSEICHLKHSFRAIWEIFSIWSDFSVKYEYPLSDAIFPIWRDFYVRFEAIFCAIWSEIRYLKRNVRFQAIFSCDIKEYFDLKRLFREIWSHIFEIRHLMRIFRAIWSENGLKRTFRLEANFSCDMKWVLLCDLKRNPLSVAKFSISSDFYVRFFCAIWSDIRYLKRKFRFEAIWNEPRYLKRKIRSEAIFHAILSEMRYLKRYWIR